jgi:UDP-2,3-diacylglucosamine pyrophosphatase LpxH
MLVIISDLHLGDGTCGKSIPPSAFYLFTDRLREIAYHASWRKDNIYKPIEAIDLVLLGDILDPQHSTLWLDTLPGDPGYVRPWTDSSAPEYAEKLREVTRAMLAHNTEGIGLLKRCAEGELIHLPPADSRGRPDLSSTERLRLPVRIHYMVGNHDWHYRLPGPAFDAIRQEIIDAMGLSNPPTPFPWEVEELEPLDEIFELYEAYGRHGDFYDKFNYDPGKGRNAATLGDVFAMEMLNRYPVEVARQVGPDLPIAIVDSLRKLTNVRPALATPLWISGQIKQHSKTQALERDLKKIWDQLGDEMLALPYIREADRPFALDTVDALEVLLHISKRATFKTLNNVVTWVREKMWGGEISYTRFALQEQALLNASARFIAYGHTHHHEIVPLDSDGTPPTSSYQIYMNTGTWHSYYTLTAKDPKAQKFVPYQMLTYLILYRDGQRGGRHFETWSGAFA